MSTPNDLSATISITNIIIPSSPPASKDLFDQSQNPSHSTLYPDVLKIKTIVVVKPKFAKRPFFIIYKFINPNSRHPAARMSKLQSSHKWICKFVIINKWHFCEIFASKQIFLKFKTSGYNDKCDGL